MAEEHFRRIGFYKTSVADIASELGMSPANVYRFFPSRDAINQSICARVVNEAADIAFAIARTNAPAKEKLEQLLTAVHHHNKTMLLNARPIHELIVAATQENWPIIKAHMERMVTIFEAIIRGASKQASSTSKMPLKPGELSGRRSCHSSIRF